MTVTMKSERLRVPGKVTVAYAGRKVGSPTLRNGKVTVKLPAKRKGRYWLTISYTGPTRFSKASRTFLVTVR